jgi:hypothetical protein
LKYTIETLAGYMKAVMDERDTAAETEDFVRAIVAAVRKDRISKVLISIRKSRPVFKVEDWKLSEALEQVMSIPGLRVAFVADTRELQMSQEYIALLGRQRGLEFQSFPGEPAAVEWLLQGAR